MDAGDRASFAGLRRACAVMLLLTFAATCLFFGATVVRGGSMYPTFVPGDIAIYRRAAPSVRVGDIVLYGKNGWPGGVLHRVIWRGSDGRLRTRGDANTVADREPVAHRNVRGVVVAIVPVGRACQKAFTALR